MMKLLAYFVLSLACAAFADDVVVIEVDEVEAASSNREGRQYQDHRIYEQALELLLAQQNQLTEPQVAPVAPVAPVVAPQLVTVTHGYPVQTPSVVFETVTETTTVTAVQTKVEYLTITQTRTVASYVTYTQTSTSLQSVTHTVLVTLRAENVYTTIIGAPSGLGGGYQHALPIIEALETAVQLPVVYASYPPYLQPAAQPQATTSADLLARHALQKLYLQSKLNQIRSQQRRQ